LRDLNKTKNLNENLDRFDRFGHYKDYKVHAETMLAQTYVARTTILFLPNTGQEVLLHVQERINEQSLLSVEEGDTSWINNNLDQNSKKGNGIAI